MISVRGGYVYIMTNKLNTVLYTGVTSDLIGRVWQHQNNFYSKSFTSRYKCYKLVYYEPYAHIEEAIAAEKLIKGNSRDHKQHLVNLINPEWRDLYIELVDERL
ncbi:GIY-YIG nuclease family protein [Mucilaginibacter sp.]